MRQMSHKDGKSASNEHHWYTGAPSEKPRGLELAASEATLIACAAVAKARESDKGEAFDVLVFLPGGAEIKQWVKIVITSQSSGQD